MESDVNEVRQRVTTYPGTGHVVTTPGASCNVHDWPFVLYHMHCNYTGASWNIQRRLSIFKTFPVYTKIDK